MDTLAGLVCAAIDGVPPVAVTSPVLGHSLGHSCTRCSGRAHTKEFEREVVDACVEKENVGAL